MDNNRSLEQRLDRIEQLLRICVTQRFADEVEIGLNTIPQIAEEFDKIRDEKAKLAKELDSVRGENTRFASELAKLRIENAQLIEKLSEARPASTHPSTPTNIQAATSEPMRCYIPESGFRAISFKSACNDKQIVESGEIIGTLLLQGHGVKAVIARRSGRLFYREKFIGQGLFRPVEPGDCFAVIGESTDTREKLQRWLA